ncbi:MAG: MBL fold metallo-hydrolase [Anaerolineae bacterium]
MPNHQPPLRLRFLGTGAAESYPAPFCRCHNCEGARRNGGRDIRRRSALLVNDDLLIDFGPDIFQSFQEFGLDATQVQTLCITHSHADHLAPDNIEYRRPEFVKETTLPWLTAYGAQDALDLIMAVIAPHLEAARVRLVPLRAGDNVENGGYSIRALPAVHAEGKHECLLYLIERQGCRFLYGTDTGPLSALAWEELAAYPPDLAILDATMGTASSRFHMGMEQVIATAEKLRQIASPSAQVIAHHFSHQNNPCYEELLRIYGAHNIGVAYDGMVVTLPER